MSSKKHSPQPKRSEALSGRLSKSASELSCAAPQPSPPRARSAHHHVPLSVVHTTKHFFNNLKTRWQRSRSKERCPAGTALSLAPDSSGTDGADLSADSTPANSPRHRPSVRKELATRMITDLKKWKRIRASIRAQFTRWESYLNTHENLDYAETHVRLQNLHEDFQILREIQQNIITEVPEKELDNEIEISNTIEEEYISIKLKLIHIQYRAQSYVNTETVCTSGDTAKESWKEESLQITNNFEDPATVYPEDNADGITHDMPFTSTPTEPNTQKEQNEIQSREGMIIENNVLDLNPKTNLMEARNDEEPNTLGEE